LPLPCAGLSLIVAIGAQNAFGLRKGLRRHVLLVVWVWAGSDLSLILAVSRRNRAIVDQAPMLGVAWVVR
jgi:L-lysine exporter family protein LysE/ArgO